MEAIFVQSTASSALSISGGYPQGRRWARTCSSTAIAIAMCSCIVSPAFGQSASEPAQGGEDQSNAADDSTANKADEIVVTGIRQGLRSSVAIKRNADQILDVVSSEDVGKFPDVNIAESLQRITGVAITRNGNEGQFITVRGLG
jgi:outer membrane receptor for ferrienterochelin and colicin